MGLPSILFVFGTRPEAIKMAPLVVLLQADSLFHVSVCVTAQHREMLDQVLSLFDIKPEFDLNVMSDNQDLSSITTKIISGLKDVLIEVEPDLVVVHGDTTTSMAASLAAYYQQVKVAHVEAGLRTGDIYSPWPEELNRKIISDIACLHFAPTESAKANLLKEGVKEDSIFVTGNTVIDSLLSTVKKLAENITLKDSVAAEFSFLRSESKLVLITGHRRENFGEGFINICEAIRSLAESHDDVDFVYPLHLNPNVRDPVLKLLENINNVHLIEPQGYLPFVYLMERSYLVLTDSGGIQEEAPTLGKPVLVMRENTERPEAVDAGVAKLVGVNVAKIVQAAESLLVNRSEYERMSVIANPYGDGYSSQRILDVLKKVLH
jgi:UDP-N-acetylglucosamine 2-epimerase (non-hydrolysing)